MAKKTTKVKNHIVKPVFTDARGKILDILEEPVNHIGMVTFRKDSVRGNHYHKKSIQYSYVLSGQIKLIVSNPRGKYKKEFILKPGALTVIPPQIVHTYKALTKAEMLDMTTLSRKNKGYQKDTIRVS